jgi:hypothetical protein
MKEICPRGNNNIVIIVFLIHDNVYILYAIIVLSGNINTCVVYEQHRVPSMPLLN